MNKMKNIAIFLLLFAKSFAQTQKGDLTISPQVRMLPWGFYSDDSVHVQYHVVEIPVHYYLSNKLSVGLNLISTYKTVNTSSQFVFNSRYFQVGFTPQIRYSFLNTRLTPFISVASNIYFGGASVRTDNQSVPILQRKQSYFILNFIPQSIKAELGFSYFVREKMAIVGSAGLDYFNAPFRNTSLFLNVGCMFIR